MQSSFFNKLKIMILIIDNYDSFTQNLVQYTGELNLPVIVRRNDCITIKDIKTIKPTHIIISPGPGHPKEISSILEIIKIYAGIIPILGVCLGHQAIGYLYGCKITRLEKPMHGKLSKILHNHHYIFKNIPNAFMATRYHSLIIDKKNISNELKIIAQTQDEIIMACQHKQHQNLIGIQFHPESLWTEYGKTIIKNFLSLEILN